MNKKTFILAAIIMLISGLFIVYQDIKIKKLENKINSDTSLHTIDSLTKQVDSLYDETFNDKLEIGRYELSLDHLYEVNPKAALEFVNYMNHETE